VRTREADGASAADADSIAREVHRYALPQS